MTRKNKQVNKDIKLMLLQADLYQYQVAEQLGLSQNYFNYLMCKPLDEKHRKRVLEAIDQLTSEQEREED